MQIKSHGPGRFLSISGLLFFSFFFFSVYFFFFPRIYHINQVLVSDFSKPDYTEEGELVLVLVLVLVLAIHGDHDPTPGPLNRRV